MGINIVTFLIMLALAFGFNVAGIRKFDRSSSNRVFGITGLLLLFTGIFAELLHAAGVINFYIGAVVVTTFFLAGAILLLLSAYNSTAKSKNLITSFIFIILTIAITIISFFFIAVSAL